MGTKRRRRDQQRTTSQGPTGAWAQAEGGKGGQTDAGHSGGSRHAARGAETSGGDLWVVGGYKVQVYNNTCRERMWGAGEK